MNTSRHARAALGSLTLGLVLALAGAAQAQDDSVPRHAARFHHASAAPPLTVHRARIISGEPIVADDGYYDGQGFFRRWNDTRLDSFYGWRLGGDNFYGDLKGEPITRGNAGLGMISGYGPARGGYGGPHFDSVGGFHNGPNPFAQEAEDYASGSIGQPHYDVPLPRYPSIKQQVADLNTGLAGTGQVIRVKSSRERWNEALRASYRTPAPSFAEPSEDDFPDF